MSPTRSIPRIRLNWADDTKTESSGPTSTASGCPSRASTASPPSPVSPAVPAPPAGAAPHTRTAAPCSTTGAGHPDRDPVLRRLRVGRAGGRSVRTGGRRAGGGPFLRIGEPHRERRVVRGGKPRQDQAGKGGDHPRREA